MRRGECGQKYNIGGENEWENIRLLQKVMEITAEELVPAGYPAKSAAEISETVSYVTDRPGHDRRYAIDCSKIRRELGWERKMTFEEGLRATVRWYLRRKAWVDGILSGDYLRARSAVRGEGCV